MPAPISWSVVALSSNPISNVQIGLELAGVEGGWQTFPGLLTLPVLNLPLVPGRAVRVVVRSGTLAAGELVSCVIAPSSWPAWAEPDPREWQPSPGLYE